MKNKPAPLPISPPQTFSYQSVTLDRAGAPVCTTAGQNIQVIQTLAGGVPLALAAVPRGHFQMGAREDGSYPDELPLHSVFLGPFWLGQHPVTQAQWRAVMGRLPDCRFHGADLPVDTLCWRDALAFCARLSQQTGLRYRLPSEAQWEYACRAGTHTPFSLGESITSQYANFAGIHTYRDAPAGVYRHGVSPVGSFLPNAWGLHEMHGTLWEFCADTWSEDYLGASPDGSAGISPHGPAYRVARGGSWHEVPQHCRSAMRLRVAENERLEYYGMRVLLESD